MIDKATRIELLTKQIDTAKAIQATSRGDGAKWQLDTAAVLERLFGKGSRQLKNFKSIRWSPMVTYLGADNSDAYRAAQQHGLRSAISLLESALDEVRQFWEMDQAICEADPLQRIERICNQFHRVARQLRQRYAARATLDVSDEYDVQDLIHSLLLLDFDDVRPEEWTPSYAGACSRMDFLIKTERIVLETKKTRKGLTAKEVGDQLLVDCQRYKSHPDCKMLICFVYDPEGLVGNPRGLENDLEGNGGELPVKVYVRP